MSAAGAQRYTVWLQFYLMLTFLLVSCFQGLLLEPNFVCPAPNMLPFFINFPLRFRDFWCLLCINNNKWSKYSDRRLHCRRTWMVHSLVFNRCASVYSHLIGFLGPTRVPMPNGISISSAVFAQLTAECSYTFPILPHQNFPFQSSIQLKSRSVQLFLHASLLWQTDRHTMLLGR